MKNITSLLILLLLVACKETNENIPQTAQDVVDRAIKKACDGNCDNAIISFNFRKNAYQALRTQGKFQYTRAKDDSLATITDVLSNEGLKRYINEIEVTVADSLVTTISDGVNSVIYFAQLPYGLNDAAVKKELLEDTIINEQPYYSIKVTFNKEGGGTDYDDQFMYWIHKTNLTVDYLAYKYATNGGGIRFREAYNPRIIEGIRFVDYRNFKPISTKSALQTMPRLFENNGLKLLSKIETENIEVTLLPKIN